MEAVTVATRVVGARATGPSHTRTDTPCQDAFAWRASSDDEIVIAVADGLGSAPRSDQGAQAAVRAAVEASADDVVARVEAARVALEELGGELRELACTLLVVRWRAGELTVAHVGDGAVVARAAGELMLVSAPAPSEYVNEVEPLTSPGWRDLIRMSSAEDVDAVALFTDGCQRAALGPDGAPSPQFFEPLFAFARDAVEPDTADEQLAALLAGAKMSEHSDDDKTLVIAVRA